MKILIHGRKNGYTVLYPKPTPTEFYSFASDIQSINANNYDVYYGVMFYTLAFVENGCIYTKYVIGDDIGRGQLGEIGISVFIPNTQKLPGAEIKKLLDDLISIYNTNYINHNKIEEPKNGFDWNLFTSAANKFDEKLQSRTTINDSVITGNQDPAFHYFESERELEELLDKPFQEEYSDYRQILFIKSNLQGTSNPLDVIKNSGVEVNPDLINEYMYLNNYSFSKGVTIIANGKLRSDKKHENQIRAKWHIEIKYSKDDRCYEPITASGTFADEKSDIKKYLKKKGNLILIDYSAFENPKEKSKELTFEIKDWEGNNIHGAEIKVGNRPPEKADDSLKVIEFRGEEIIKEWKVSAEKKSEDLYSETISIIPNTHNGLTVLSLQKQKVVKIFATDKDTGDYITNFKYRCNDGKGYFDNVTEITFINDEIDKPWEIEVTKKEGRNSYIGKTKYLPALGDNPLYIHCERKDDQFKTFEINAGEHGEKTSHCPAYSSSSSGDDLSHHCIIANKGYVFTGKWVLQNETLVAQYEKRKSFASKALKFLIKPGVIAIIILAIAAGIILLRYFKAKDKETIKLVTENQINEYVLGDSLMLDKLNAYEEKWKIQKGDGEVLKSLMQAIEKRSKIDSKKFDELEYDDFKFSEPQQNFINAIDSILDSGITNNEISNHLGDISSLTLTQIVDSVYAALALKSQEIPKNLSQGKADKENKEEKNKTQTDEPEDITNYLETSSGFEYSTIDQYHKVVGLSNDLNKSLVLVKNFISGGYKNCNTFKMKASNDRFLKINPNLESWIEKVCKDGSSNASNEISKSNKPMQTPATTDKTAEIIQYLKGIELEKDVLNQYLKDAGNNKTLKTSINLSLKLWSLNGTRSNSYSSYQGELNEDTNLKNSELKNFVDAMCSKDRPKYIIELPAIDQRKTLSQLKSKLQ